jgi:sortase A
LRHGPGHISGTALPGEPGNSAIAGHRTTYGAPFANLDDVNLGDEVRVTTGKGRFTYTVSDVTIVGPNRTDVLRPQKDRTLLTLITCHPRWSTAKRLIVVAELSSSEPIAATTPTSTRPVESTIPATTIPPTSVPETSAPAVESTEAVLVAHFLRRTLRSRGRRDRHARLVSWAATAVPFLVVLFYWYHFINMLLPAST